MNLEPHKRPCHAHLIMNGIIGLLPGWGAFPVILVALLLQGVFFQYGGITTLGVNTVVMACGVLAFVRLVVPTTYSGDPMARSSPLTISRSGVQLCTQITLKAIAILLAFTALLATMSTSVLGHSLHKLGLPSKLVHLLLLAYRYIFVIEQEYQRLFRAAKIRNFHPATNMHTFRTYAYMVGMLFVRASERAGRVHQAMKCRGFQGRFFTLAKYRSTAWNGVLGCIVTLVNLVIIYLEWIGS